MKIQLDTTDKVIKIDEAVNLGELTETLDKLLPGGKWKEFTLETNTQIKWNPNPIIIERDPHRPYDSFPWEDRPRITYMSYGTGNNNNSKLPYGTFGIKIK